MADTNSETSDGDMQLKRNIDPELYHDPNTLPPEPKQLRCTQAVGTTTGLEQGLRLLTEPPQHEGLAGRPPPLSFAANGDKAVGDDDGLDSGDDMGEAPDIVEGCDA